MLNVDDLARLSRKEGIRPVIPLPEMRFTESDMDPPLWPPAYSSLLDKAKDNIRGHLRDEILRHVALRPVKLLAGQSNAPNGEFGRPAAPDQQMIPEMLGGRVLKTNV